MLALGGGIILGFGAAWALFAKPTQYDPHHVSQEWIESARYDRTGHGV